MRYTPSSLTAFLRCLLCAGGGKKTRGPQKKTLSEAELREKRMIAQRAYRQRMGRASELRKVSQPTILSFPPPKYHAHTYTYTHQSRDGDC